MILCSKDLMECRPCCDFCIHVIHDVWMDNGVEQNGEPIGCNLHTDGDHQQIAENCSWCQDFQCFQADRTAGKWFEREAGEV